MKIYTDSSTSVDVTVSEGNKWYSYVLPKDKGLYKIEGDSVKKVVVKADINGGLTIIPPSTVEASFKGSDTSKVKDMSDMFNGCTSLRIIGMIGCSQDTIQKITNVKPSGAKIVTGQTI